MEKVRLDKYLWATRIFKTRNQAAEQCKKGNVFVNDMPAKASKEIKQGDILKVKYKIIYRTYKVLKITDKRVSAKLVPELIQEITSETDLLKLKIYFEAQKSYKPKFKGRPTKKDRRDLNKFLGKN